MKTANRTKLLCRKHLVGRIYDTFTVNVPSGIEEDAKKEYERQGYTVSKLN